MEEIQKRLKQDVDVIFHKNELMTEKIKDELKTLRENASIKMAISINLPIADIFLNDRLLGKSPQVVRINPKKRNTISISAPAYYEEHFVLSHKDYKKKKINISLQKVDAKEQGQVILERTYGWLANRRKDPKNPVLMRAVAQFFTRLIDKTEDKEIKKQYIKDAKSELVELLNVAPGWYMAHNQMGIFVKDDFKKSLGHYKIATGLNPDNYLGYFNQACAYARNEMYDEVFEMLHSFKNINIIESYSYSNIRLKKEKAFDTLKSDETRKKKFNKIVNKINKKAKEMKKKREDG